MGNGRSALVRLAAGDQVVADGKLVSADGLALDESNRTGESELDARSGAGPAPGFRSVAHAAANGRLLLLAFAGRKEKA